LGTLLSACGKSDTDDKTEDFSGNPFDMTSGGNNSNAMIGNYRFG
jgi:hypothetical protein